MPRIAVGKENSTNVEGKPVVLIQSYPLSALLGTKQLPPLINAGYRVITYGRRGSAIQPAYRELQLRTFAGDLHKLIAYLMIIGGIPPFSCAVGNRFLAVANPMPVAPPVITAILPSSEPAMRWPSGTRQRSSVPVSIA